MKLNTELQALLLNRKPQLIEHFFSLEGEGATVGRSALFIRTNQCNLKCSFCDTSYSIKGDADQLHPDMTSESYTNYLIENYSEDIREHTHSLSITGGEPLLNLDYLKEIIERTMKAFPAIKNIIIETNGILLQHREICLKLVEQVGKFVPNVKFILSISPKLSGKVSHSDKLTDDMVLEQYKKVIINYKWLLDAHFDIQLKVVHSDELKIQNEPLIRFALGKTKEINDTLRHDQILVMPFTPPHPIDRDKELWEESKDNAAKYAMKYHFRYSPRIHIDRRLD